MFENACRFFLAVFENVATLRMKKKSVAQGEHHVHFGTVMSLNDGSNRTNYKEIKRCNDGTRGLYGFKQDGKLKLNFVSSDAYPEGLGLYMLSCLRQSSLAELPETVSKIELVACDAKPPKDQRDRYSKYSCDDADTWDTLLYRAEFCDFLEGNVTHMPDCKEFLDDLLFCEWVYVVDLDKNCFRVYAPNTNNRVEFSLNCLPSDKEFLTETEGM